MIGLVAVNDPFTLIKTQGENISVDLSILKREALMFNTICVPSLKTRFFQSNYLYKNAKHILDELDWLMDKGIVRETPKPPAGDDTLAEDVDNFVTAFIRSYLDKDESQIRIMKPIEQGIRAFGEIDARYHTLKLREEGLKEVYPVVAFGLKGKESEAKSNVIDIVIESLPTPHEDTPWEQIYDLRADPDTHRKFLALKTWMNDVAKMNLEPNEVKDKLESLLAEYEAHMKLHRVKTGMDSFKTILLSEIGIGTAGWLTGYAALAGLGGIVGAALFTIKMRQITLLEEEKKAPGKEVAYIVKVNETF
jgi:hypothetical protein